METTLPTFETNRLILREVTLADVPSYQSHFADYDVIQYLSANVPWPYPENGAETYLTQLVIPNQGKTRWNWGIFLKSNPTELIGAVELFVPGLPEHRGFWLAKKYWNKGYMTEALKPVTEFAFNTLNLDKLIFANAVQNNRSRRVKEKSGAKYLDTRPAKYVNPKFTLSEFWELSRSNWESGHSV